MAAPSPRRRISAPFLILASLIIWLVVVAPLAVLISWAMAWPSFTTLLVSLLLAPPVGWLMWMMVQSANRRRKWPAMQLIGINGILMSVVAFLSPLTWVLSKPLVAFVATAVWIALCVFAIWRAHRIVEIPLAFSHPAIDRPYTFVHTSDLHAGSRSPAFIKKVVDQINRYNPDGVFISGDLLDSSQVDAPFLRALQDFQCPCWVSLGNHERYVNLPNAVAAVEQNGAMVLRNSAIEFGPFQIIGIDDADKRDQVEQVLPAIKLLPNRFRILLYHRPDGWAGACKAGIELMLAGHTHAGQIWPFGLLVKCQFRHLAGRFDDADSCLYVSQGTGTWGPTMRLGTRSEIAILQFSSQ